MSPRSEKVNENAVTFYCVSIAWWRSALLAISAGNSPVNGEFPAQRPVTRSFDAFFDLRLNKRLSKQSWVWRFETPSRPLWRHCNGARCFRLLALRKWVQDGYPYIFVHHYAVDITSRSRAHCLTPVASTDYLIMWQSKWNFDGEGHIRAHCLFMVGQCLRQWGKTFYT